ncbi:MAG: nucleotidyltransferase family protein [Thermus sp.]|uniref:nucleotidyltransferase family protein n=1 Tax=Thermus sp. TaxID=275 RepID=UPI00351BB929
MGPEEVKARIGPYREELRERLGVEALYLFGSSARGEAGEGSDVDLLVRFSRPPGFLGYMGLKLFLEDLLGRPWAWSCSTPCGRKCGLLWSGRP